MNSSTINTMLEAIYSDVTQHKITTAQAKTKIMALNTLAKNEGVMFFVDPSSVEEYMFSGTAQEEYVSDDESSSSDS